MRLLLCVCALIAVGIAEKEWVWGDNARSNNNLNNNQKLSARYEIFEPDEGAFNRPNFVGPQPHLPPPGRPFPVERPGGVYAPGNGYRPINNYGPDVDLDRPHVSHPDYVRPPLKQFDTCTCTQRFNCQSPGVSYGHCDVGKQYCCFNKNGQLDIVPAPSKPIHSPENGILVGPGAHGGAGYGQRPSLPYAGGRPSPYAAGFQRPLAHHHPHHGRPPSHSIENGILVGPGGPFDRH